MLNALDENMKLKRCLTCPRSHSWFEVQSPDLSPGLLRPNLMLFPLYSVFNHFME